MRDDKKSPDRVADLAGEAMQDIAREGELLQEMAQEGGQRREFTQRLRRILLAILLPLLVALTAANLLGYGPFNVPVETPSSLNLLQQMRAGASYAVDEIQAFQEEHGRFPDTLEELGSPDEGAWAYERLGPGRYRITVIDGDFSVLYDSNEDPDVFFADVRETR